MVIGAFALPSLVTKSRVEAGMAVVIGPFALPFIGPIKQAAKYIQACCLTFGFKYFVCCHMIEVSYPFCHEQTLY